jgi:energy-coupling factor transporter ATP-binding protein EcfA2
VFKNWYWRADAAVGEEIVAALAMATWVQSAWAWRPMVSITGASDSGKSTLFETLETLFGPLALLSSKSTEAGIRQSVANRSRVILCDEFESDKHRKGILELFRTASKGSKTLRGTMGQTSREYGLRHIPWVTAIEVGLQRAPDRNRFIMLEMDIPPKGKRGVMNLPTPAELEDLGQRILAVAVRHVARAAAMAERIKSIQVEGIHGRVVESFATPVAMAAVAQGFGDDAAAELLKVWVTQLDQDPSQGTKDETELLGDILSSSVNIGHGSQANVGQIVRRPDDYGADGTEAMERAGVAIMPDSRGRYVGGFAARSLFVAVKSVSRYLLKGTRWDDQSIETILKRLRGAFQSQRRMGGHRPRGVEVPMELVEEKFTEGGD